MLFSQSIQQEKHEGLSYGCVFCNVGAEHLLMTQMEQHPDIVTAFVARKAQHKSQNGLKSIVETVMLPGYVFFRAESRPDLFNIINHYHGAIRLLAYDNEWELRGEDYRFAEWLWQHNGLVGVSTAHKIGDHIRIEKGPLKELEGYISKIDRHNRNGLVNICFGGKLLKAWLPFEVVSEIQA